ncbi:MAG: PQ-loop repeat-containing protein [Magnetococcales bacterium]|nr:PQ-loop repeat-containing protein [Magnetococcales bacterium]
MLEWVGWLAMVISIMSLLPQLWKTWRSRSARDLSFLWLFLALASAVLWTLYGVLLPAQAMIWTNSIVGVILGLILLLKLRFD